jgi:hypothetical protein
MDLFTDIGADIYIGGIEPRFRDEVSARGVAWTLKVNDLVSNNTRFE